MYKLGSIFRLTATLWQCKSGSDESCDYGTPNASVPMDDGILPLTLDAM